MDHIILNCNRYRRSFGHVYHLTSVRFNLQTKEILYQMKSGLSNEKQFIENYCAGKSTGLHFVSLIADLHGLHSASTSIMDTWSNTECTMSWEPSGRDSCM